MHVMLFTQYNEHPMQYLLTFSHDELHCLVHAKLHVYQCVSRHGYTKYADLALGFIKSLVDSMVCAYMYYMFMKYVTYVCIINLNLIIVVLTVEFASGQFTGSESSGFIEVIVRITGGTSNTPITVTVTPSVQSPVSAMGMLT